MVDEHRLMTKTQHYRKVTKPLLERKRRARMNLYLDELKDLIIDTMESQGEHVTKLEKADILELTVNYLKSRKQEILKTTTEMGGKTPKGLNIERFNAGYTQAAYEVSRIFAKLPDPTLNFGTRLVNHLGCQLKELQLKQQRVLTVDLYNTTNVALRLSSPNHSNFKHKMDCESVIQDSNQGACKNIHTQQDVWRPW